MDSLAPGPRDHLITSALERALAELDPELLISDALDPAEAPERLARHLMAEVRRALADQDSADAQAGDVDGSSARRWVRSRRTVPRFFFPHGCCRASGVAHR